MSAVPSVFHLAQAKKFNVQEIDPSLLRIEHDCQVPRFRKTPSKYAPIFEKLKVGSAIVCEPKEAARIASRLREWVETEGINARVRQVSLCKDGMGRVWLLEK